MILDILAIVGGLVCVKAITAAFVLVLGGYPSL